MKYKLRRFVFMLILVVIFAYVGSKSFQLTTVALGGLTLGYLFSLEDKNWVHKNEGPRRGC